MAVEMPRVLGYPDNKLIVVRGADTMIVDLNHDGRLETRMLDRTTKLSAPPRPPVLLPFPKGWFTDVDLAIEPNVIALTERFDVLWSSEGEELRGLYHTKHHSFTLETDGLRTGPMSIVIDRDPNYAHHLLEFPSVDHVAIMGRSHGGAWACRCAAGTHATRSGKSMRMPRSYRTPGVAPSRPATIPRRIIHPYTTSIHNAQKGPMSSMPMLSGGSGKAAMLITNSPAPHGTPNTLSTMPKREMRQKWMAKSVMLAAMRQSQAMSSPKWTASLSAMSDARDASASGMRSYAAKSAC